MFRLERVTKAKCFVSNLSYLSSKLWHTKSKSIELSSFRILFSNLNLWLLLIILKNESSLEKGNGILIRRHLFLILV